MPWRARIVDLGCGPGTFELAFLFWIRDHDKDSGYRPEITAIDAVKEFLEIFRGIWAAMDVSDKRNMSIVQQNVLIDKNTWSLQKPVDIILLSNSLGEVLRDSRTDRNQLAKNLIDSSAVILIIDYRYDPLLPMLDSFLNLLSSQYDKISCSVDQPWGKYFDSINLGRVADVTSLNSYTNLERDSNVEFVRVILVPKHTKYRPRKMT